MKIDIPHDLAESIARAIESHADWFRRDSGHSALGIAVLLSDADRLDAIAEEIRERSGNITTDRSSASWITGGGTKP